MLGNQTNKYLVYTTIILNSIFAAADRVAQLIYYSITLFNNSTTASTTLAFILIKPIAHFIMITIYLSTYYDFNVTIARKIKFFFIYMLSSEVSLSIGAQYTFKSKYSQYAESILITMKVLNTIHLMFTSLPQLLIVTIYSSSIGTFKAIDIAQLCLSSFFILWSIAFYALCLIREEDYEVELEDIVA